MHLLCHKWDRLACVEYTNIHTEQRYCPYCIFAQIWVLGDNSTKLAHCLAVTRTIHSYKNKEITHYILTGSSCYMLILEVYSFLTQLRMLGCWRGCSLFGYELSRWSWSPPAAFIFFLVTFPSCLCQLHASSAVIQLSGPSGLDVPHLSVC